MPTCFEESSEQCKFNRKVPGDDLNVLSLTASASSVYVETRPRSLSCKIVLLLYQSHVNIPHVAVAAFQKFRIIFYIEDMLVISVCGNNV